MHRILIVSDDPFLRDMVRFALGGLDAEVRSVSEACEIRRVSRSVLFDVVIVLTVSPFACCDCFDRRRNGLRRPVFYVVAWQHSEQTVLSLLENGADQYMTFPVNLQRLRGKVADELNRLVP